MRAKYLKRLVEKHTQLLGFRKWTTKEIILYGRWFGYTPQSVFNLKIATIKAQNAENVRDIVKSELMREHLQNDIISFNSNLKNWISQAESNEMKCSSQKIDDTIDVDIENDEQSSPTNVSPMKPNSNCMELPIANGSDEVTCINEVCRKMQIRFDQEEIVGGKLTKPLNSDRSTCENPFFIIFFSPEN